MAVKQASKTPALLPHIEGCIQVLRGVRVMVDVDLAALYGVETKRLNEQVKRNRERFPADFLFQLTLQEKAEVVANCDHLQKVPFFFAGDTQAGWHAGCLGRSVLRRTLAGHCNWFACAAASTPCRTHQRAGHREWRLRPDVPRHPTPGNDAGVQRWFGIPDPVNSRHLRLYARADVDLMTQAPMHAAASPAAVLGEPLHLYIH